MKLTIIPSDNAVYEDGLCYSNLIWEGTPVNVHALQFNTEISQGWIEFNDGNANENITAIPSWAQNAKNAWQIAYDEEHQPPEPPTAEQNKQTAMMLLQSTDWTTIPDVSDSTKSNPYLANVNEFIAYRNAIRQYAIYPVAGNIDWAVMPNEVWQTV